MRVLPLAVAFVSLFVTTTIRGAILEGTVADEARRAISNVYLTVIDDAGREVVPRRPLLTSHIAISIPGAPRTLRCVIEASGYELRRLTVEVLDERAQLNHIVMKRSPGLRLSPLAPGRDDRKQWIDVLVFNDSDDPATIVSLALRASNASEQSVACLDLLTPDVVVELGDIAVLASLMPAERADTTITPSVGKEMKTASKAKVSALKCHRVQLEVDTTLGYRVARKEDHKLRLMLPLVAGAGQAAIPIDLSTWKLKRLTLRLSDGREYASP